MYIYTVLRSIHAIRSKTRCTKIYCNKKQKKEKKMSNFKQKIIRSVSHSIVIFILLFIRIFNHIGRLHTRWKIGNGINVHVRYKLEPIITFIYSVKYGIRIETRIFYKKELQRETKWTQLPKLEEWGTKKYSNQNQKCCIYRNIQNSKNKYKKIIQNSNE